jgi:signal transduction histidine kinase/ActR/RegA family two-component response regulator
MDTVRDGLKMMLDRGELLTQTEHLLHQSQSLTTELESKARQLSQRMREIELKNREIEQARAALEEKAEQLSLSSRYKSEFLANMSHELRTPLNSLLILARLLADNDGGNLSPKQVEFARTIHASGAELLALINDILDLAKIESGTVTLNIAPELLSEICDSAERTFRPVADGKGLAFEISVTAGLPAALETDGKRLQQILTNLLSNAFKFTAKGGVRLALAPAGEGWSVGNPVLDRGGVVALSVVDTGIGIPPAKQRLIFEAFQQADGTTSREYGGTGLGLSISRELARLLGGEIRLSSAPGLGSAFTLYLPLGRQPAGEAVRSRVKLPRECIVSPVAAAPARRESELAGRSVLVVDDDIRNVFALTSALEARGLRVIHADSGKQGIELLRHSNGIDAVLMDVMMPGLDGHDAIRIVRQLEGCRWIPVLAVTAKAMLGDREKCIAAGATDYIAKPVDIDDLLAKLRHLIPAEKERER